VVSASVVVVVLGGVVVGALLDVVAAVAVVDVVPASSPAQAARSRPASKTPRIVFVLMPPRFFMPVDRRRAELSGSAIRCQ
jgi:hypothetical protein